MWMSRRDRSAAAAGDIARHRDASSLRQALVEIRRCAEQNDPASLRRAILSWARLHHGRHFASFGDLTTASSESLAERLMMLDRSLYGGGDISTVTQGLVEALREEPAPRAVTARANELTLYPT